jgi:predicted HTH domain antitoxin
MSMAAAEKEINSLIRTKSYASREEVISEAVKALLVLKPDLRKEIAIDLYKNGEVRLWKAAEMAGLSLEEFKELLASRSKEIEIGTNKAKIQEEKVGVPSKEERTDILEGYIGIIRLKKPLALEEILDLEEDTWLY